MLQPRPGGRSAGVVASLAECPREQMEKHEFEMPMPVNLSEGEAAVETSDLAHFRRGRGYTP